MNASENALRMLHKEYLACVDEQLTNFLAAKPSSSSKAAEWCAKEKNNYFDYMRANFKTDYDNILRLESQNF